MSRPPVTTPERAGSGLLVLLALLLTGLTMRVAVTSIGAELTDLQRGLHISSAVAGVLTTLPVIAFAGMGFLAPALAHRLGDHRLVAIALAGATAGLALRVLAGDVWVFAALSLLALAGGAIANVLMPSLVKRHFPDRIGPLTAAYTTCLAIGATAAAGLSVPVAELTGGGWRLGIGCWAVLTAVAVLPWLPTLRHDVPAAEDGPGRLPIARIARTRLGWALAMVFGTQSFQAYVAFGWFANFFRHNHVAAAEAGLLVAFYSALSIPISMVIPAVAVRGQRGLVAGLAACGMTSYLGMLLAPVGGAWLWMLLGGIGSGMFPLTLTMIGLRSCQVAVTASLSAFTQGVGYLVAGTGPLLVGLLLGLTGDDWTWPLVLLVVANIGSLGFGWYAASPRLVEDELNMPAAQA
ncbi:MAG: MFS transporter [Jatrophihabitantaceae bacterium]